MAKKDYYKGAIPPDSNIRIVRDLAARTISFIINGVDKGIAFSGVHDGDLYGVVHMFSAGNDVYKGEAATIF